MHMLRRGGVVFAATQALGWGLFSGALLCLTVLVISAARGMAYCIRCWIFATGSVMLASQLVRIRRGSAPLRLHSEGVLLCRVMLLVSMARDVACCARCWVSATEAASCSLPRCDESCSRWQRVPTHANSVCCQEAGYHSLADSSQVPASKTSWPC